MYIASIDWKISECLTSGVFKITANSQMSEETLLEISGFRRRVIEPFTLLPQLACSLMFIHVTDLFPYQRR
jgi:hypothetical protein